MENRDDYTRQFLVKAMSERDMSQSDLARLLETEPSYINRLVNGKKAIGLDVALKLAKLFSVSIDDIVLDPSKRAPTLDDAISILSLLKTATPLQIEFVRSYLSGSALAHAREKLSQADQKSRKP